VRRPVSRRNPGKKEIGRIPPKGALDSPRAPRLPARPRGGAWPAPRFRPPMQALEDRTVPSSLPVVPSPASNGGANATAAIARNDIRAVGKCRGWALGASSDRPRGVADQRTLEFNDRPNAVGRRRGRTESGFRLRVVEATSDPTTFEYNCRCRVRTLLVKSAPGGNRSCGRRPPGAGWYRFADREPGGASWAMIPTWQGR
jgi:hypothetical protein